MSTVTFWPTGDEAEPELTPREKAMRDAFVKEYLLDYDPVQAAIKLGFKTAIAETYAKRFMNEAYVLKRIAELEGRGTDALKAIRTGLVREANFRGAGASHSARVSALAQLSKIEGMEKAPVPDRMAANGVVLHLTRDDIAKLSDTEIDTMVSIFSKLNITLATMPESVGAAIQ